MSVDDDNDDNDGDNDYNDNKEDDGDSNDKDLLSNQTLCFPQLEDMEDGVVLVLEVWSLVAGLEA